MLVDQISVFVENKPGRVHRLTQVLRKNNVDLLTLSIADTKDYGILRCVTSDNKKAMAVLREAGFTVSETKLIGVEVPDRPGGLADVLDVFDECGISIEYLYSFAKTSDKRAVILFRVENTEEALRMLEGKDIRFIDSLQ